MEDRERLRAEFGFGPHDRVCVVSVGGSGVGGHLLRRVVAAFPAAARAVPGLRMVVVTGPRIDPASVAIPSTVADGEVALLGFVPELHRLLAACDLAVAQGGLTTTMDDGGRPAVHLCAATQPLRTEPARATPATATPCGALPAVRGSDPDTFAAAVAAEIGREVDYLPVPGDGAARAAARLAELL